MKDLDEPEKSDNEEGHATEKGDSEAMINGKTDQSTSKWSSWNRHMKSEESKTVIQEDSRMSIMALYKVRQKEL